MHESQQTMNDFIEEQAQSIVDDLLYKIKNGGNINIDDVYWNSLYAVDDVKTSIADAVFAKLEKQGINIE